MAVAPNDDTLVVSGGADSVINLWDDKTLELDEEAFKESEGKILLEQDMTNALRAKDYKKAVMLAFELKKPYQLLKVINEIIAQGDEMETLDSVVSTFTDEQVCTLQARAGTLFFHNGVHVYAMRVFLFFNAYCVL